MIAFVIEYRKPGKTAWHPIGIAGTRNDVAGLIAYIKSSIPHLANMEVRLHRMERIPGMYTENEVLGAIPIITDEPAISNCTIAKRLASVVMSHGNGLSKMPSTDIGKACEELDAFLSWVVDGMVDIPQGENYR